MDKASLASQMIPLEHLLDHAASEYLGRGKSRFGKLKKVSRIEKARNKRELKRLFQRLLDDLEPCKAALVEKPGTPLDFGAPEMKRVKSAVSGFLQEADEAKLLFDRPFLMFFIERGYLEAAQEFIAHVRTNDPQLTSEEIFQAMRNVWILNSLQLCWGLPVELTPSVYAYSLLYPYTDNFLDNPEIDRDEKRQFNKRLSRVLNGEKLTPASFIEEKVFSLVGQIESQYGRDRFPGVFESLRLIQEAQTESAKQDGDRRLAHDEILSASLFKGGTSVLADAFLVKGNLDLKDMRFAFAYGSFLQLLDDLQDAEADRKDHHQTLFSNGNGDELFDEEVMSLVSFIFRANAPDGSDTRIMSLMKEVISSCTLVMVMDAVGRNPRLISRSLYRELESYSKVSLAFYKEFGEKFNSLITEMNLTPAGL